MAHSLLHIQNKPTAPSEGLKNVNGEISDCKKKFIPHSDPVVVSQERKGSFSVLLCLKKS